MPASFGTLEGSHPVPEAPDWSTPFRIALLGDYTGRANRKQTEEPDALTKRKPRKIDRGNFDEVLAGTKVGLELEIDDKTITIEFQSIDDFHPDSLHDKVDAF